MAGATPPAVIIAAGRTPIGTARAGTLANVEASDLAKPVLAAVIDRSGLGHPIAATGAQMVTSAIHELRRHVGGIGVLSMCAGGGMGSAMVIEVA